MFWNKYEILIISDVLKAETAQSHQTLEKILVGQIHAIHTKKDYIKLLGFFYSYFGSLEVLIDEHILPEFLPDIRERRKTNLISQDLLNLTAEVPPRLGPNLLPVIQNHYQAFGALYVIEGSSLGGVHIAKMIQKKLPEVSAACKFFEGYGEDTIAMWRRFKSILDNLTDRRDQLDSIISGAQESFVKFAEWINSDIKSKKLI